jgi:3-isopropylmalate/(R)-2-methylmalate dehydratase large subunit
MERAIRITGRVLFLSSNPEAVRAQLGGANLTLKDCLPLRDNVSTDEITPVTVMLTYDARLGRYAHVGFKVGDEFPIGVDAIKNGGFEVIVAGKRYGKGSSRESSPLAEKSAGIRLIVAESLERIYRQNCDNIGILTTTDFSILDRISVGEAVPLDVFLVGRDEVTQDVIRAGGLLPYSKAHLPRIHGKQISEGSAGGRPMTLAEKIIARRRVLPAADVEPGEGMFLSADWRFSHDYFTGMCAHFMHDAFGSGITLERPDEIIAFQDHLVLAGQSFPHVRDNMVPAVNELFNGHRRFVATYPVRAHGELRGESGSEGICHAIMAEKYALPGQVVVGTDSHTPHSGSLGCLVREQPTSRIVGSPVSSAARCRRSFELSCWADCGRAWRQGTSCNTFCKPNRCAREMRSAPCSSTLGRWSKRCPWTSVQRSRTWSPRWVALPGSWSRMKGRSRFCANGGATTSSSKRGCAPTRTLAIWRRFESTAASCHRWLPAPAIPETRCRWRKSKSASRSTSR